MRDQRGDFDYADEVARASSVPSGVFRVGEAELESAARGTSEILRHYLAIDGELPTCPTGADDKELRTETVPGAEIRTLIQRLVSEDPLPPPNWASQIEHERLWILADAAINGSSLDTRLIAAEHLATTMDALDVENVNDKVMSQMIELIAPSLASDDDEYQRDDGREDPQA